MPRPRFFRNKKAMDEEVKNEEVVEDEVSSNEEQEESVDSEEQGIENSTKCESCNGFGLSDFATAGNEAKNVCKICEGSGQV